MKRSRVLSMVALLVLGWAGYRVYLAHADLVTLNVRNMDVRRVAPKLEWQTWERIVLHTNVSGTVTLNVRRVPLTEVLNIIALQTGSRWTALYPIFTRGASTEKLEKVVRGEISATGSGWANLEKAPGWRGGGSVFGNTARAANNLVSAQIDKKDLDFAALALSRFSQAQVVPEDNARGTVNLKLDQEPFAKAVAAVAKQVHRKWDVIFTLQPTRSSAVVKKIESAPTPNTNSATGTQIVVETNIVSAPPPPQRDPADQARQMEAFLATMTPEERKRTEEQFATMQEIQALPEAERQQRMLEMAAQAKQSSQANLEQRVRKRLRDGTSEQRVARDKEVLRRRQEQEQARK